MRDQLPKVKASFFARGSPARDRFRVEVLTAIIHRGRIFALVRAARGAHDLHAQPEFSPQG